MLDFIVGGFSIEEFRKYYLTLHDIQDYYVNRGLREPGPLELGEDEKRHFERDPNHLIMWSDNGEIVGHCIWHETSTEDMSLDDPSEAEVRECLMQLFGGEKNNLVELHELWLKSEHRGKGFGHQFFDFFEDFASRGEFDGIVHYTDHEAVIALCRKRGYKEAFLERLGWYVFGLPFSIH